MSLINEVKGIVNENLQQESSTTTMQLPNTDVEKFMKRAGSIDNINYSVKLDGVRCLSVVDENYNVKYLSRNNKEFFNFGKFDEPIKFIAQCLHEKKGLSFPIEIDGEVISKDKNFSKMMTQLRRLNNADPSIFFYYVFDIVLDQSFDKRFDLFSSCVGSNRSEFKRKFDLDYLDHYTEGLNEKEDIYKIAEDFIEKGEEGAVFKTFSDRYERKRSNSWFKIKDINSLDLEIVDVKEGTGKYQGMLGALIVDFQGNQIPVGTGFSDEERSEFFKNPPIGKLAEIKYHEITKDNSLRFPVFVRIREEK